MIKRTFLLFILLLFGCGADNAPTAVSETSLRTPTVSQSAAPAEPEAAITILAFGDSLTEGFGVGSAETYPAQLEQKLVADGFDVEVVNGGIGGETSSGAISRLDWMLGTEPDIVIVETGGNDGLRGVDLSLTQQNVDDIVAEFSASGAVVVVAGMQIIQNLGEEYTSQFAAIYPETAEKHDAILIPFFLEGVAADPDLNLPDFIHPNADGYAVLVDHIYPFVLEAIAEAEDG